MRMQQQQVVLLRTTDWQVLEECIAEHNMEVVSKHVVIENATKEVMKVFYEYHIAFTPEKCPDCSWVNTQDNQLLHQWLQREWLEMVRAQQETQEHNKQIARAYYVFFCFWSFVLLILVATTTTAF